MVKVGARLKRLGHRKFLGPSRLAWPNLYSKLLSKRALNQWLQLDRRFRESALPLWDIESKRPVEQTVIMAGTAVPDNSCVRALLCLKRRIMFRTYWPSAVPTGGAKLALPAVSWNLIAPILFFSSASPPL